MDLEEKKIVAENKHQHIRTMKSRTGDVRVTGWMLLIGLKPSGESQSLPSDQPPALLALSLRTWRRRTGMALHIYSLNTM